MEMRKVFPTTQQVLLEDNYRSTSSILALSLAIVAQGQFLLIVTKPAIVSHPSATDKTRVPKSLRTSHPVGPTPSLTLFRTEQAEAQFIAQEMLKWLRHCVAAFLIILSYQKTGDRVLRWDVEMAGLRHPT